MLNIPRLMAISALAASVILLAPNGAHARSSVDVSKPSSGHADVDVTANNPGSSGSSSPGSSGGSGGKGPTHLCYLFEPQPPKTDPIWEGNSTGAIYMCNFFPDGGRGTWIGWADNPPTIDPEVLARQVVASMPMDALPLSMVPEDKPGSIGLIGLPTWLWTPAANWQPLTASRTEGGVSVSVTAKIDRIVYNMGDGGTTTCMGPGTPYDSRYAMQRSPDCGYMYQRTSVGQPGNAFRINAVTYWIAHWEGGGASGDINIDLTSGASVRIGESQALRK